MVAHPGLSYEPLPMDIAILFEPVQTQSLRLEFRGGAALYELEVYSDSTSLRAIKVENDRVTIRVAGDARGRLIGTVSSGNGAIPWPQADVRVDGTSPVGEWKMAGRTDDRGFFCIEVPACAAGMVHIHASKGGQSSEATVDLRDLSLHLTPKPPSGSQRLSLNGAWQFLPDPPKEFLGRLDQLDFKPIAVPASWEMQGFVAESGLGLYRKRFSVPADWSGKPVRLRADAIYSRDPL